eukprot:1674168-Pleurochrysis_carterae.AAC.1
MRAAGKGYAKATERAQMKMQRARHRSGEYDRAQYSTVRARKLERKRRGERQRDCKPRVPLWRRPCSRQRLPPRACISTMVCLASAARASAACFSPISWCAAATARCLVSISSSSFICSCASMSPSRSAIASSAADDSEHGGGDAAGALSDGPLHSSLRARASAFSRSAKLASSASVEAHMAAPPSHDAPSTASAAASEQSAAHAATAWPLAYSADKEMLLRSLPTSAACSGLSRFTSFAAAVSSASAVGWAAAATASEDGVGDADPLRASRAVAGAACCVAHDEMGAAGDMRALALAASCA